MLCRKAWRFESSHPHHTTITYKSNMKQLLKFSASWCGPCKALSATMSNIELPYELIEVDVDTDFELAARYGIRGVPTLVLIEDDNEVDRKVGAITEGQLKLWLGQH